MHARSALFDVYGDHLRARGSQAPVAGLVRLLASVGIAEPAVRTAISRMVMQGWLEPVQLDEGRGYRATPRAIRRLDDAADRIYRRTSGEWDGSWRLAFVTLPPQRPVRTRVRADLRFLGYAELAEGVWVSPFPRTELTAVLDGSGAALRTARADGFDPDPIDAWDLTALRSAYETWLAGAPALLEQHAQPREDPDEAAFAARFHLVHEWRKFLFEDPGLPDQLLPEDWPGRTAAGFFAIEAGRLQTGSDRFVTRCLDALA
jgi:phenylacetic acid degradation operon negative regulatory protein